MKKYLRIAAFVLACVATLGFTSCKKADYSKSWKVVAYTSEGETQKQYVGFNVKFETSSDKKISVWLKVLDFDKNVDSVDVTIDRYLSSNLTGTGYTSAKAVTYTLKPDKGCNKNKNGKWVQIVENWSYGSTVTSHYVRLTLTGGVTLGEIAFVDEDGKQLTATVECANVYIQGGEPETTDDKFTKEELTAQKEFARNGLPLYLVDEQDSFDKN